MSILLKKIEEAQKFISSKTNVKPVLGIILGTGLGSVAEALENRTVMGYESVPHFPVTTVETHAGEFIFGELNSTPVAILSGRFHFYEGYSMAEITFPIRVLKSLGVKQLLITNISGGLRAELRPGELVLVNDHINLMPEHPLRGPNESSLGPRFPDMAEVYDIQWRNSTKKKAEGLGITLHEGVYAALSGPSLETPAEYRFLHTIGADMVGMSSVPEAIVARHMNMQVQMISMISNLCYPPEAVIPTTEDEIIQNALNNVWRLRKLILNII